MLSVPAASFIEDDLFEGDPFMAVDDMLNFTYGEGVTIPNDRLDSIEATVNWGWYDELVDRTRGWIAKHRARARGVSSA